MAERVVTLIKAKAGKLVSRTTPGPAASALGLEDLTGLGDDEEDAGLSPPSTAP